MQQHDLIEHDSGDLIERLWLAAPDRWRQGVAFDPWRHTHAMLMAGQRPCGVLPAALVVKR